MSEGKPVGMPRCATCKAFDALQRACRRHAPVAVPIPQPGGMASAGIYPATTAEQWCCEHVAESIVTLS